VLSYYSDKIGRRKSLLISISIGAGGIFSLGFAPSINVLMILIFISGFGLCGYETIIYVYISEISGNCFFL